MDSYRYGHLFPKPYADLLALVVPQARELLAQGNGFPPFAAVGSADGSTEMVGSGRSREDSGDISWALLQDLGKRVDAGDVVSAAQCRFLSEREMVWGDGAGISVLLEARDQPPVHLLLLCRRGDRAWTPDPRPLLLPGMESLFAGGAHVH